MTNYTLTPHETVTVVEHSPERLVVQVVYGVGGSAPPPHLHPSQSERFEVTVGAIGVKIGGAKRVLQAGDVLDIPRGTPHALWNAGDVPATATWITTPAGRTLEWFRALDRLNERGMPGLRALAPYLREYADVFRIAGPQPVIRPALALLGAGRKAVAA
jgi:mannose-6-phosphate isomerase-like protein (cupin superfamily)